MTKLKPKTANQNYYKGPTLAWVPLHYSEASSGQKNRTWMRLKDISLYSYLQSVAPENKLYSDIYIFFFWTKNFNIYWDFKQLTFFFCTFDWQELVPACITHVCLNSRKHRRFLCFLYTTIRGKSHRRDFKKGGIKMTKDASKV